MVLLSHTELCHSLLLHSFLKSQTNGWKYIITCCSDATWEISIKRYIKIPFKIQEEDIYAEYIYLVYSHLKISCDRVWRWSSHPNWHNHVTSSTVYHHAECRMSHLHSIWGNISIRGLCQAWSRSSVLKHYLLGNSHKQFSYKWLAVSCFFSFLTNITLTMKLELSSIAMSLLSGLKKKKN